MKLFKLHKPALIFSVYRKGNTEEENAHNHGQAALALSEAAVPFKELRGRYDGLDEQSFLVDEENYATVRRIAQAHQQVCILYLDEYRNAYLVDTITNEDHRIGHFQPTGTLLEDGDHTYDPRTQTNYVVR